MDKTVNRKELYKYKGNTSDDDFSKCHGVIDLIDKIKNGDVTLRKAVDDQHELKSRLGEIKKRKPKQEVKSEFKFNEKC